jgi:hypothetical protein
MNTIKILITHQVAECAWKVIGEPLAEHLKHLKDSVEIYYANSSQFKQLKPKEIVLSKDSDIPADIDYAFVHLGHLYVLKNETIKSRVQAASIILFTEDSSMNEMGALKMLKEKSIKGGATYVEITGSKMIENQIQALLK